MNFIMMSLLYHTTEPYIAFYLFTTLLEEYDVCDNYESDLQGVNKHCSKLESLVAYHLPSLHNHFQKHSIQMHMFSIDWILTLFSSLVPLDSHHIFLNHFLDD